MSHCGLRRSDVEHVLRVRKKCVLRGSCPLLCRTNAFIMCKDYMCITDFANNYVMIASRWYMDPLCHCFCILCDSMCMQHTVCASICGLTMYDKSRFAYMCTDCRDICCKIPS